MKKLFYILLLIILLVVCSHFGIFKEADEIEQTRADYSTIYGEKAKYFTFSK